jgi:DNA-binding NarL/FixJ family response regulator
MLSSSGIQMGCLAAGVDGYVVKSDAARDLIPELRRIQGGEGDLQSFI